MATHVWVNPERFHGVERTVTVDGVDLYVQLSPFDAPTGVHGCYDRKSRTFEIRFEYMNSEPEGEVRIHDGIQLIEGRHSGKLLAIRIPVDSRPLDSVGLIRLRTEVVQALKKHSQQLDPTGDASRPYGRFLNWEAARELLDDESDFKQVAGELMAS